MTLRLMSEQKVLSVHHPTKASVLISNALQSLTAEKYRQ